MDIYVETPATTSLEVLQSFGEKISDEFPERAIRDSFTGRFTFDPNDSTKDSATGFRKQTGFIFRTAQRDKAVQSRADGFSFNRLPTYTSWNDFSSEARKLWNIYRSLAQPIVITGLGLRYINRMEIPLGFSDFREYCLLFPSLPRGLPTQLAEFFMHFRGPSDTARDVDCTVTTTFEPPSSPAAVLPLILDVHVTKALTSQPESENAMWEMFAVLRRVKNELFESSITPKARELFR